MGLIVSIVIIGLSIKLYLTTKRAIVKQDVRKDIRLMGGKMPLLLMSFWSLLAAVNQNSAVLYILYILFQLILAFSFVIVYAIRSKEFKKALELEMTKKERRKELKTATQLSAGIMYKPAGAMNSQQDGIHAYPYMNHTSSSETSKPNSDNFERRPNSYKVAGHSEDDSDGHDSEEDPLVRKTRKANRKLRLMKLRNHEHSSQSGLESDRRPKIKWHDQNDLQIGGHQSAGDENDSGSLKVMSKSSNIPDIIPSIEHLDEAIPENRTSNRTSSINSDKQRLINSMKR